MDKTATQTPKDPMHHIMNIDLPKHGLARFLVEQTPEHCGLDGGRRYWQTNAIFPQYRKDPEPVRLPTTYRAHLLAPDATPTEGEPWNRELLAGYIPYGYTPTGARITTANPGTIKIRGRDMGELTAHVSEHWTTYKTNLSGSPSPGEQKWLDAHLAPALKTYIKENARTLYADAYASTLASIADALRNARAELDKLEAEARIQTAKLPKP